MSQRPTGTPGREGQAGQQIGDSYSSQIPWVGIVRAIGRAVDFGGGGANRQQRQVFREAGGTIVHKGKGRWTFTYQGQRVSEKRAIQIAKQFKRGLIPRATGGSVADMPTPPPYYPDFKIWQYLQWYDQPRGPRTRKRYKRKKKKALLEVLEDPYGGIPGGALCGSDSECYQWAIDHGVDPEWMERGDTDVVPRPIFNQAFTRTFPDDIPPVVVPIVKRLPALSPVLAAILGVFWPGRIGEEAPLPMPTQPGQPTGPRRRYRVTPRPRPSVMPEPAPQPAPAPRPRAPAARPSSRPEAPFPTPLPLPDARPVPAPDPAPKSRPIPGPGAPSPTTGRPPAPSTPRTRLPFDPLTLLPLLLTPRAPARTVDRYRPPVQSPLPIDAPLTSPFAYGVRSPRTDECQCDKPRKRRKSQCRNPITSRTTRTRGGRRYRTITRRLDCK